MFNIFKDLSLYNRGIDPAAANKERNEKLEEKRSKVIIFPAKAKATIIIIGALYLVLAVIAVRLGASPLTTIKFTLSSVVVIATCVFLVFKSKKTEIAALIFIALFFLIQVLFTAVRKQ
jgi:hypothetical protein